MASRPHSAYVYELSVVFITHAERLAKQQLQCSYIFYSVVDNFNTQQQWWMALMLSRQKEIVVVLCEKRERYDTPLVGERREIASIWEFSFNPCVKPRQRVISGNRKYRLSTALLLLKWKASSNEAVWQMENEYRKVESKLIISSSSQKCKWTFDRLTMPVWSGRK